MKVAIVCLALVSLAYSAPQQKKVFHENFDDFMTLIIDTIEDELLALVDEYTQFDEFNAAMNYLMSTDFRSLVYEMEDLPEFKAVIDFLEQDNIDVTFFLDLFNELLEYQPLPGKKRSARASGTDFNSFIADCVALFPKDQLSALYDQKMADDEEFRVAMENLNSSEWNEIFGALWDSATFQVEVATLAENGIDVHILLTELLAIFGQN